MTLQKTPIALAAVSLFAAAPLAVQAAPTVSFTSPAAGTVYSKTSSGVCAAGGTGISRVVFTMTSSSGVTKSLNMDSSSPYNCYFNPYHYLDGVWTLKATAYDSAGATATATRQIAINNNGTTTGSTGGTTTNTPPAVAFSKPANNSTVAAGSSVACEVSATDADGISKLEWLLDGRLVFTETSSPFNYCNISSLSAGTHTITARATDKKGAIGQAQVTVTAGTTSGGDSTGGTTNTPPAISISAPANNATVAAGSLSCYASATDANGIAKVEWFLDGRLINTEFGSPYDSCNINTSGMSGAHVIKARATDKLGAVREAQVTVNVGTSSGGDSTGGGGSGSPSTGSIDASDIKTRATADVLFSTQPNIYADILGSSPWMSTVPESGAHGSTLPNGETIRFGKQTDPLNSSRKALSFQLAPSDPTTGGSKRVELGFPRNIEYNKTYWLAVSVYAHDWGTLATNDQALFGFQLHNGTKIDLSPTIALYTTGNGRSMQIQTRYSTSGSPSQSNSVTQKWPAQAIPFGRWMDFVVKFRNNVGGQGYAQVWLDGNLIVNHQGNLGFNTPGYLDFVKWGYYNWTSGFASPRKVRLRNPTLVADPTGSKYTASEIRTILTGGTSSTSTAATGTVQ